MRQGGTTAELQALRKASLFQLHDREGSLQGLLIRDDLRKMRICLYLELESKFKGSGIGAAIRNQRRALELNNVEYTGDLKDEFNILHINSIGLNSLRVARRMRKRGKKVVMHAHTTADDFRNSYRFSNFIAPLLRKYLTFYYNHADLVLCPSEYTKGVLKKAGVKVPIKAISNGIDTEKFKFSKKKRREFRREFELDGVTPLSVGHVFIRKGISTFINLAGRLPNKFVWVGRRYKGMEAAVVSRLIENAPENFTLIDFIQDIVSAYSGSDIFLFPSHCENQGIVILEASSCKMPIIVRDLPVYEGWLEGEVNCLKARSDKEFKDKLKMLIEDEKLRNRLGKNAYGMSRGHSLKKVGEKLERIYSEVLE